MPVGRHPFDAAGPAKVSDVMVPLTEAPCAASRTCCSPWFAGVIRRIRLGRPDRLGPPEAPPATVAARRAPTARGAACV
jgi:hypothetical protein